MKAKFTDHNIDQTFKEAIDPLETQPSEKFWTEASDAILERANKSYIRKVRIWKMTSLALAAMLVTFIFYTFYTTNKLNSIQQQVTSLEKPQVLDNNKTKTNENNEAVNVKSNVNIPSGNSSNTDNPIAGRVNAEATQNSFQNNTEKNPGALNNKLTVNASTQAGTNEVSAATNQNAEKENATLLTNENSAASSALSSSGAIASVSPVSIQSTFIQKESALSTALEIMAVKSASAATSVAVSALNENSINFSPVKHLNPVSRPSRFSIGIFVAPSMTGELNNSEGGNTYSNNAEGGEKARIAFDAGINVDYVISHRWAVESGVGYHTYSFSMQPTLIWAKQSPAGQVGYSIVTSCGILQLPYQDSQLQPGDNVNANGIAYCSYLSVPLQLKYKLVTGKHLGIYLLGGAIANFTIRKGATIHLENTTDLDNESVNDIQGLSMRQYSYTAGAGISYFLGKGFSIFGEPFMNGSITPIDEKTPVISYPYFIGLKGGLSFNF